MAAAIIITSVQSIIPGGQELTTDSLPTTAVASATGHAMEEAFTPADSTVAAFMAADFTVLVVDSMAEVVAEDFMEVAGAIIRPELMQNCLRAYRAI
jgi:hypothetical protein